METLELIDLEALESIWDQEHCQAQHADPDAPACTHIVAAISTCVCKSQTSKKICAAHATFIEWCMDNARLCAHCNQWASDCWGVEWV